MEKNKTGKTSVDGRGSFTKKYFQDINAAFPTDKKEQTKVSSSSATNNNSVNNDVSVFSSIETMTGRLSANMDEVNSSVRESNQQLRSINKYAEDSSIWLGEIYDLLDKQQRVREDLSINKINQKLKNENTDANKASDSQEKNGGGGWGSTIGNVAGAAVGGAALRGIATGALALLEGAAAVVAAPEVLVGAAVAAAVAALGYGAYKAYEYSSSPEGGAIPSRNKDNPGAADPNKSLMMDIRHRGEERKRYGDELGGTNRDRQDMDVTSMQWADQITTSMGQQGNGQGGRAAAESYLGRKMSDEEYDYLIRATHAESSAGRNADPKEQAMIMASILNRARDKGENGVIEALTAKNQFQSVTGTSANNNAPSENFTQGPDTGRKNSIESSASMLNGISQDQKDFTAASSGAYGAGTNIGYRDNMIASGGTQIGGSVFNTAGPQDMGAYSPVDASQQQASEDKDDATQLTTITTASGKSAQVNAEYASNFQGFLNDLEATGYKINSLGGYANRANVNNPSVKSYHAMGAAIDINPEQNPNNSTKSDLPPETAALAAAHGLGWGMNWKSVKDPMHFSAAQGEQGAFDIKRGSIAPGEVQGGAATGGGGKSDATAVSSKGSVQPLVASGNKPVNNMGSMGKLTGNLIGNLSKNTALKSAIQQFAPTAPGVSNGLTSGSGAAGSHKSPTGGSSNPLPAIDNMFAKLFDESAMFG
jgi:LAS superfamily LD-carboxypeptidase LdcB